MNISRDFESEPERWFLFNDGNVKEIDPTLVVTEHAYMLIYSLPTTLPNVPTYNSMDKSNPVQSFIKTLFNRVPHTATTVLPLRQNKICTTLTVADRNSVKHQLYECGLIKQGIMLDYVISYLDVLDGVTLFASDFDSFKGWLNDEVIRFGMTLFEMDRSSDKPFLLSLSTFFFPQAVRAFHDNGGVYDSKAVSRWTKRYKYQRSPQFAKHLHRESVITTLVHIPGHWFTIAIKFGTLHIFNGFSGRNPEVEAIWQGWWKCEHEECGLLCTPLVVVYHNKFGLKEGDDIEQTDGSSCGVSGLMHYYHIVVEDRFAHAEDFTYKHIVNLRIFLALYFLNHGKKNKHIFQRPRVVTEQIIDGLQGQHRKEKAQRDIEREEAKSIGQVAHPFVNELDDFYDTSDGDVRFLKLTYPKPDVEDYNIEIISLLDGDEDKA